MNIGAFLAEYGLWVALGLGLLALAVLILVIMTLKRGKAAAKPEQPAGAGPAPAAPPASTASRHTGTGMAFTTTLRRLSDWAGVKSPYALPWFLLIGEAGSGKSSLLHSARVPRLLPLEETPIGKDATLHAFEGGIVIDARGALIMTAEGRPGDRDRWRGLTRRLQAHRPQRGLDGLILTIPVTDLTGAGALGPDSLLAKGDILQERLLDLMRQTGLRLPVHIVVTQCDRLPGFTDFWQMPPAGGPDTMLGWSQPHVSDLPFEPADIDKAMVDLTQTLWTHYVKAAAGLDKPADPDGMFSFPASFAATASPLKTILGRVLRVPPYQEGHFLRGIWFTGAQAEMEPAHLLVGAAPPVPAAAAGVPPPLSAALSSLRPGAAAAPAAEEVPLDATPAKVMFVTDLLAEKLFRETRLTRPARAGLIARTRGARIAQLGLIGVTAALVVGLVLVDASLRRLVSTLEPPLELIRRDMAAGQGETFDVEAARQLLTDFEGISRGFLLYGLIPSSWSGDTEDEVVAAFGRGIHHIVLSSLHKELEARYLDLARHPGVEKAGADGYYLLSGSADLKVMADFVADVSKLDRLSAQYHGVTKGPVEGLADLSNSLFKTKLDGNFAHNSRLYQLGLESIKLDHISEDHPRRIRPVVEKMSRAVLMRLGPSGEIAQRAGRLRDAVVDVRQPRSGTDVGARMQDMADALVDVRQMLDDPGFFWLGLRDIATDPMLSDLLRTMDTPTVGRDMHEQFATDLRNAQQSLRTYLTGLKDNQGQPLFVPVVGGAGLRLNDHLDGLSKHFQPALARPFMRVRPAEKLASAPPAFSGRGMSWDSEHLAQAVAYQQSYEDFRITDLPRIPSEFQGAADRMARQRLENALRAELVAAQRLAVEDSDVDDYGEAALTSQIRDLSNAREQLMALLTILSQYKMDRLQAELRQVLREQSGNLLQELEELASTQSFYEAAEGFEGWDGQGSPRPAGFYTSDAVATAHYLDGMRGRLDMLWDNLAGPLEAFMTRGELGSGWQDPVVLGSWQSLGRELLQYRAKAPGSTLAALEQFIRFDLDEIRLDNCESKLAGAEKAQSGDFFLYRRELIRQQLLERCQNLTGAAVQADYGRLAETFNAKLAGRYPFTARDSDPDVAEEADPDDLALFLRDYGPVAERLNPILSARAKTSTDLRPAARFVESIVKMRTFLAPFAAPDAGKPPEAGAYEVTADFRVNRQREQGANQIIEWVLQVGGGLLHNGPEQQVATWRPGDPVALRLRWAKDGAEVPLALDDGPGVEDRSAIFGYTGRWALLRLLQAQKAGDQDVGRGGDPQPHLLRFTIPTIPAGSDPLGKAEKESRIYVRVALASVPPPAEGGGTPAKRRHILPSFPVEAPPYENASVGGGR